MISIGTPQLRNAIMDGVLSQPFMKWISNLAAWAGTIRTFENTLNPASVAANTKARQTFTVSGLTTNDIISVNPPSLTAGLDLIGFRVSATDTLELVFWNSTGAPIDEGAGTYLIFAIRK